MSVIRINKTKDYVVMSNEHLKEKEMSLKAKGLLSQMLSLPDNWEYSIAGLVALNKENETSIKSTLEELKKFGYLKVTKLLPNETKTGRIEYIYDVYEKKQEGEKQGVENLGVEFLGLENQGQYNINKLNNNKLINNNKKENTKRKFGEYKNVLLTDDEYKRLNKDYPNCDELIKFLDEYIEMKGYKAKSHNLAIRKWVVDAVNEYNKKHKLPNWWDKDFKKEEDEYDKLAEQYTRGYLDP